jgi:hypothetical protein
MPQLDVPLSRLRFGQTSRKDAWWLPTFLWGLAFVVGFGYLTWGIIQPHNYWAPPYLTPLASPLMYGEGPHAWFGHTAPSWWPSFLPLMPGLFIIAFPGGFRMTCYYYRGKYYKSLWADPVNCAVGEPRKEYRGEAKWPLLIQNVHRYFLYFAIVFIFFLSYDVYLATRFPVPGGTEEQTTFGLGLGTLIMAVNVVFICLYTFGCHSFRHLIGGVKDIISGSPVRKKLYNCATCLNSQHGRWAMASLYSMCTTDIYIRLCAAHIISDPRILF